MGKVICPFCEKELQECKAIYKLCCDNQNMITDNGRIVCKNCGEVDSYNTVDKYIDFYENNRKIIRKSVYHTVSYKNIINNISVYGIKVSVYNSLKICRILKEIEKVLPQVNGNRKRMINTNFILKQLFKMFKLPHENISISK